MNDRIAILYPPYFDLVRRCFVPSLVLIAKLQYLDDAIADAPEGAIIHSLSRQSAMAFGESLGDLDSLMEAEVI